MGEKDDELGLNLSLSLGTSSCPDKQNHPPLFPLNLMLTSSSFQNAPFKFNPPASQSTSDRNVVPQPNVGGIDVNLPAKMADGEEEMVVSSPNSTVSSVSHGKRSAEREENEAEEDGGGDAAEKKKLRLSKEQSAMLEETFKEYNTLNQKQKVDLAGELNLRPRQVEVWFQNRRARTKLKQTEVDCDYLRRCCEALTKENKRLQKEVNELRALKFSPQLYMNMSPPTTLTMCPQCQRLAVSSSFSSTSTCSSLPTTSIVNRGSQGDPMGAQPHRTMPVNPSRATHFPKTT